MRSSKRGGSGTGAVYGPNAVTFGKDTELYYHAPGPPPKGAGGSGVGNEQDGFSAAIPQSAGSSVLTKNAPLSLDTLHFQIHGKGNGGIRWMALAPRISASLAATNETEAKVRDAA